VLHHRQGIDSNTEAVRTQATGMDACELVQCSVMWIWSGIYIVIQLYIRSEEVARVRMLTAMWILDQLGPLLSGPHSNPAKHTDDKLLGQKMSRMVRS
jgi:hypothetical protein